MGRFRKTLTLLFAEGQICKFKVQTATAARPLRPQLRGALLAQRPVRGSYISTTVQGSPPWSASCPVLPPITYSRPPTHATLQLDRACCSTHSAWEKQQDTCGFSVRLCTKNQEAPLQGVICS